MAKTFDFTKLRRVIIIYGVVQALLIILLIYMSVNFQATLQAKHPQLFLKCVGLSLIIQLALFYPINKFASSEARREVENCAKGLTSDELKKFRSRRMVGDVVKASIFIFFITFIWKVPQNSTILCITYITFILTFLSYFQYYNFAAKREMKERS
jgi:hypothetical protein